MTAPAVPRTMPITSATDGRTHRVAEDAHSAALAERSDRYPALCGRRVPSAPMICPPGPDCPGCAALAGVVLTGGRHRRPTTRPVGRHRRTPQTPTLGGWSR